MFSIFKVLRRNLLFYFIFTIRSINQILHWSFLLFVDCIDYYLMTYIQMNTTGCLCFLLVGALAIAFLEEIQLYACFVQWYRVRQ